MVNYENVSIDKIKLWTMNPRLMETIIDEKKSIRLLFNESDIGIQKKLAKDMLKDGISYSDLTILVPEEGTNYYFSYEGNRRVSIIKALFNPTLLDFDKTLEKFFIKLAQDNLEKLNELRVLYSAITDHDNALKQIDKLHTNNNGINRKTWGSEEKDYFNDIVFPKSGSKRTDAYYILNNYGDKFTKELKDTIKYSSINRLLGYSSFKDVTGISSYENLDDDNIEIINYYFEQALIVEQNISRKISRFTQPIVREHIIEKIRLKLEEIKSREERYIIEFEKLITITQRDSLSIDVKVIDKIDKNEILSPKYYIKYFDKNNLEVKVINTEVPGTYVFKVEYEGISKEGNIIIKKIEIPNIILNNYTLYLEIQDTLDLRAVLSKMNKFNTNEVKIHSAKNCNALLDSDIFLGENAPGIYTIVYSYKANNLPPINEKLVIHVDMPKSNDLFTVTIDSIFSTESIFNVNINQPVNYLIKQVNELNFDNYYLVIAATLRTILELTTVEYLKANSITIPGSLENKIKAAIDDFNIKIKTNYLTVACKKHNVEYYKHKNFIEKYDNDKIKTMVATLHLSTHTSGTMITKQEIQDLGRVTITGFILIFHFLLN